MPENAIKKFVTWASSNQNIVSVDKNGKVTALNGGKIIVTVTTKDGSKKATCKVTVAKTPKIGNEY